MLLVRVSKERLCRDDAVGTRPRIDDNRPAESLGELVTDDPRGEIDRAARRRRNDKGERA